MKYTAIADTGEYLVRLLRQHCVPEPLKSADKIGLCALEDFSDYALCLSLYDIQTMDRGLFEPPPEAVPLCLRYALTAHSQAAAEARAPEEHRLLGKAVSVLAAHSAVTADSGILGKEDYNLSILIENLNIDEKMRIFGNASKSVRAAVFYSVSPIFIGYEGKTPAVRIRSVR